MRFCVFAGVKGFVDHWKLGVRGSFQWLMVDGKEPSSPWGRFEWIGQATGDQAKRASGFVDGLAVRETWRFGRMVGPIWLGFGWSSDDFGSKGAMVLPVCLLK